MKKIYLGIPYAISILLTTIFAIAFSEAVSFHIAPVIVIAALVLQAIIMFARDSVENSNLSSGDLNRAEVYSLMKTIAYVTLLAIPLLFPFAIFFGEKTKAIVSCSVWLLTFLVGFLVFRIKYGGEIKNRICDEEKELSEQKKREEQGLI